MAISNASTTTQDKAPLPSGKPEQTAPEGEGELLERDYRALVTESAASPEHVMELLKREFPTFSPPEVAEFRRLGRTDGSLARGDEMEVNLTLHPKCQVRVIHEDEKSITLRTLEGHPEAGRITFGASRTAEGLLELRIRSRARVETLLHWLGYHMGGKAVQTYMWVTFLTNLARATQGRVVGEVEVKDARVKDNAADKGERDEPTFVPGIQAA